MDRKSILEEVLDSQDEKTLQSFDPAGAVQSLLKLVDSRGADVLRRRYSLDGNPTNTLEEIGNDYGVTRERIRQIESAAIKELRSKQNTLDDTAKVIVSVLNVSGRVMQEDHLLDSLLENRESNNEIDRAATLFVLELHDNFELFNETNDVYKSWGTKEADLDLVNKLIKAFIDILSDHKKPISHEKALSDITEHSLYGEHKNDLYENAILAHFLVSKQVKQNPFGEWGLSHWSEISPRGVKDKAFIVLQKHAKPIHFADIAKKIDDSAFDQKKAHPQTVHNELIKDPRFILVGRGIYALKEWGYKPGTVADVIAGILQDNGAPMSKDDLVKQVLEQRLVKRNTVLLGLQNKQRFKKMPDGQYWLTE